ncbi:MAG: DHA2 family efflux MFS transporter permease subunit [Peptococcaceae bacterium]|nr:DHA2 family efflux MFS transporter permease subunit [Peptococcaceae bacterium]MDH7526331.1 DHA2 family efflux MFS transporter permease subunit [Peptococcaceae bacterium]
MIFYAIAPRDKIGKAMGAFGMVFVVAPSIGPTLGGYLVEYVNWRWIFTINIPVGVIGLFLAYLVIPEFKGINPGKFDLWGALTSASGMFCLLFALSEGPSWGWTSEPIVCLFYFSLVSFVLFIYHELHTPEPLLDLRIFTSPVYTVGNAVLVVLTFGMFGALFYIPVFLQSVRGLGALQSGMLMLPPALASAVMMPISGALYDRIGPRLPVLTGILLLALSTFLFSKVDLNTPLSTIIFWNVLRSMGMGLTMMPTQASLMSEIPTEKVGRASAVNNIIARVSGSFGIAVLTGIMTGRMALHTANLNWAISASNPLVYGQLLELSESLAGSGPESVPLNNITLSIIGKKFARCLLSSR